jgi:hypothetical protein
MELHKLLSDQSGELLDTACSSLSRAHLKSYTCSEESENRKRLAKLLDLTIECISRKKLMPMLKYIEEIARERYYAGFDFTEVHSAINVLEETLWKKINSTPGYENPGEALGLVSTVLGAAKESLARTYISLVSKTRAPALDLNAIFERN